MIGTIQVKVQAATPNLPLQPLFAFKGSPSSLRIMDVPKSIGQWNINEVSVSIKYPDNSQDEKQAVRTGNVWVATVEGCDVTGRVVKGYEVLANGVDEDGNPVVGYVLGSGDVFVLERDSSIPEKDVEKFYVKFCETLPANPQKGDVVDDDGTVKMYDGNKWIDMGDGSAEEVGDATLTIKKNGINVGNFTANSFTNKTIDIAVPSTTNDLVNDSGFITSAAIPSTVSSFENDIGYITASAIPPIPSATSNLVNDSGFITASTIPSNVGAFTNDVGYLTSTSTAFTAKRDKTDLVYEYHYNQSEYWNIPRWVVVYDGSTFNLDKYDSEKLEWTDGSGDWKVAVDFAGMEVTPYFTLFYQTSGLVSMHPETGAGSTTWDFTQFGQSGTVEMNMDGTLTTVDVVEKVVDEKILPKRDYSDITYYATSETYSAYTHGISTFKIATTFDNIGEQTTNAPTVSASTTTWALDDGFGVLTSDGSTFYFQQSGSAVGSSFSMDELKAGAVRRVVGIGSQEGINVTANANFFKTEFAMKDAILSKTSDLVNDSGFITASALPSQTSDLVNDSGFITASAIPSNVGAFTNDVGYLTSSSAAFVAKRDKTDLEVVVGTKYPSWYLSALHGTTFSPAIELKWGTYKIGAQTLDGWLGYDDYTTQGFALLPNLQMLFWVAKNQDGTYLFTYGEDITLSSDELSIETIATQSNQITCTRTSKDGLPDVSSLATLRDLDEFNNINDKRDWWDNSYPATQDTAGRYTIDTFSVVIGSNSYYLYSFSSSGGTSTWKPYGSDYPTITTTDGLNFTLNLDASTTDQLAMSSLKPGPVMGTIGGIPYRITANFKMSEFAMKDYVDAKTTVSGIGCSTVTMSGTYLDTTTFSYNVVFQPSS